MFENILNFFKKLRKSEESRESSGSKDTAKERLHLVLMQDRANVSADFLELMKQEIIEVIKKYIEVEEDEIDVRLTNNPKEDGTTGAPSLYANIPILNIRNDMKKEVESSLKKENEKDSKQEDTKQEDIKQEEHNEDKEIDEQQEDEDNQEEDNNEIFVENEEKKEENSENQEDSTEN